MRSGGGGAPNQGLAAGLANTDPRPARGSSWPLASRLSYVVTLLCSCVY
jgi:hypothetical protein